MLSLNLYFTLYLIILLNKWGTILLNHLLLLINVSDFLKLLSSMALRLLLLSEQNMNGSIRLCLICVWLLLYTNFRLLLRDQIVLLWIYTNILLLMRWLILGTYLRTEACCLLLSYHCLFLLHLSRVSSLLLEYLTFKEFLIRLSRYLLAPYCLFDWKLLIFLLRRLTLKLLYSMI